MLLCYQFLAMLFLQFENSRHESIVLWSATGCRVGRPIPKSFTMLVFQPYANSYLYKFYPAQIQYTKIVTLVQCLTIFLKK